jgi:hypothetical protein
MKPGLARASASSRLGSGPSSVHTFVVAPDEADLLRTAFYNFIELHGRAAVNLRGACSVRPEPLQDRVACRVSLWSDAALAGFAEFWERFRVMAGYERERREALRWS